MIEFKKLLELLEEGEELEKKATSRPWAAQFESIPGYTGLLFWRRKEDKTILFDNKDDAIYITWLRNNAPEIFREIKNILKKIK